MRRYLHPGSTSSHSGRAWSYLEFDGFVSGFTRAREALGTLVLIALLSMERFSAAATVGRRYLWINALDCDSKEWKYSPGTHRRLGNGWLHKYPHSSHLHPRHGAGLKGLDIFPTVQAANLEQKDPHDRTRSGGRAFSPRGSSHSTSELS